jgi:hypothetical protein
MGQGIIIETDTGRTVAVSYDQADAELLAAGPEMLELLLTCTDRLERLCRVGGRKPSAADMRRIVADARKTLRDADALECLRCRTCP